MDSLEVLSCPWMGFTPIFFQEKDLRVSGDWKLFDRKECSIEHRQCVYVFSNLEISESKMAPYII